MNIPVDGVIVRASGVQCNESAMTGEPDELKKESQENCLHRREEKESEFNYQKDPKREHHDLPSPLVLSGTQFATGEGWFIVVVVGKHSCVGKIFGKLETKVETTPLQEKLEQIGSDIGKLGRYCAILTIHVLFLRFFIEKMSDRSFDLFGESTHDGSIMGYCQEWLGYFIIGITIIVVAVPEGLPLAVMISLAYSVRKMLADQNFVKRLASCEIMGGANNICSDKTGTLTMNKMTVTNIWAGRELAVKVNDEKYSFKDYFNNEKHTNLFKQAICCNTSGSIKEAGATEQAMLIMMNKFDVDFEMTRKEHLPLDFVRFHFTSKRKRMSTIIENCGATEHGYDKRIHIKGASEIVLGSCTYYLN
jgi:Ca2+ transporting ATPase